MEKTKLKRHNYRKAAIVCLAVAVVFLIVIYESLPLLVEYFTPGIIERAGLGNISFQVKKISPFKTDISDIVLGDNETPAIRIDSAQLDYSLWNLAFGRQIKTLKISGAEINCAYDGENLVLPSLDLTRFKSSKTENGTASKPFIFSDIKISRSILKLKYNERLFIIPFDLSFSPGDNWKAGSGKINLIFREQPISAAFSFDESVAQISFLIKNFYLDSLYGFSSDETELSGLFSADIKARVSMAPFSVKSLDASLQIKNLKYNAFFVPEVNISAKGAGGSFEINSASLSLFQNNIETLRLSDWRVPISIDSDNVEGKSKLQAELPSIPAIDKIPMVLNFQYNLKNKVLETGLNSETLSMRLPGSQAAFRQLSFKSEIKLPSAEQSGDFSIENITYGKYDLGGLKGSIKCSKKEISFEALAPDVLLPSMKVELKGKTGKTSTGSALTELSFNLPEYKLAIPYDIGAFFPKAKGITFQGNFSAEGLLTISQTGLKSGARVKVTDSVIEMKTDNASAVASGVSLDLQLDDLFKLASLPSQYFSVKKFTFGSISLDNIYALFHIESFKAILFEGIGAQWCSGTVSLQSIRINPAVKNYALVISCDRVNLAHLLRQFNVGRAEGDGALNGKIPVFIRDDEISFGNGFLYSTPGDSGKISIKGGAIDSITDGVPDGTPQFDQLKLSQMALRDFDYDWVKLYMNTEGNDMLLKLQFDGKPAKPLPFVYKKEIGGFAKVDVNSPGSIFQGIRLDVNIRLPFNKLMRYNKKIQDYIKQQ